MTADRRGTLLVRRTTVPDLIVVPDFNCKEQQFGRTLLRTNIDIGRKKSGRPVRSNVALTGARQLADVRPRAAAG
jgi:hypothetical protein